VRGKTKTKKGNVFSGQLGGTKAGNPKNGAKNCMKKSAAGKKGEDFSRLPPQKKVCSKGGSPARKKPKERSCNCLAEPEGPRQAPKVGTTKNKRQRLDAADDEIKRDCRKKKPPDQLGGGEEESNPRENHSEKKKKKRVIKVANWK